MRLYAGIRAPLYYVKELIEGLLDLEVEKQGSVAPQLVCVPKIMIQDIVVNVLPQHSTSPHTKYNQALLPPPAPCIPRLFGNTSSPVNSSVWRMFLKVSSQVNHVKQRKN